MITDIILVERLNSMTRIVSIKFVNGLLIFLTIISVIFGCDSGIKYRPKDWEPVRDSLCWTKTFGHVEITLLPIGGLTGQRVTTLEMSVMNHSDEFALAIVGAMLMTKKGPYPASFYSQKPLQPGEAKKVGILWEFKEPINDIFIEPIDLSITVSVGDEQKMLVIPMVKFWPR